MGGSASKKRKRQGSHLRPVPHTAPGMLHLFPHSALIVALPQGHYEECTRFTVGGTEAQGGRSHCRLRWSGHLHRGGRI